MNQIDFAYPTHLGAAWSGIAEPGDVAAGRLRSVLGTAAALRWVLGDDPRLPVGQQAEHQPAGVCSAERGPAADDVPVDAGRLAGVDWRLRHQRWHPRAARLDVAEDLRNLGRLGGYLLVPGQPGWPSRLSDLGDGEPPALWVLGLEPEEWAERRGVALVGSRAASAYGVRVAEELAYEAATNQLLVVSGGAYGVDTAAHRGALLAAKQMGAPAAVTVSVMCGGVGNLYPAGNAELFKRIAERGAVISESPPHWRPARWRFLERNRIIAALADLTVVVEAGRRSGALATGNRALDLGRSVAAVPGSITTAAARGSNELLRAGAEPLCAVSDVVSLVGGALPDAASEPEPNQLRQLLQAAFPRRGGASTAELSRTAGISVSEAEMGLLEWQLAGGVRRDGDLWLLA